MTSREWRCCSCLLASRIPDKGLGIELTPPATKSAVPSKTTDLFQISSAAAHLRDACCALFLWSLVLLPTPQGLLGLSASSSVLFFAPNPKAAAACTRCVRALLFWLYVATAIFGVLCLVGAVVSGDRLLQQLSEGCAPVCGSPLRRSAWAVAAGTCVAGCDCLRLCPSVSPAIVVAVELLAVLLNVPLVRAARRVYARTQALHGVGRTFSLL